MHNNYINSLYIAIIQETLSRGNHVENIWPQQNTQTSHQNKILQVFLTEALHDGATHINRSIM